MDNWKSRSFEIANNLNPAFCLFVLNYTISEYESNRREGVDLAKALLILPIILHKTTREALPRSVNTKFHSWVQNNQFIKIGLSSRVENLIDITKEAILFGISQNILELDSKGNIHSIKKNIRINDPDFSNWIKKYSQKAKLIGRWFARIYDTRLIYTLLGLRL